MGKTSWWCPKGEDVKVISSTVFKNTVDDW